MSATASPRVNTTVPGRAATPIAGALDLYVIGNGEVRIHPLPDRGALIIGRGEACDVCIDHPGVSRRHARLHVAPALAIEDLSSCNGTRLRGLPLPANHAVPIAPGELVALDGVLVVARERNAAAVPTPAPAVAPRPMDRLLRLIDRIAASAINVLILGETGAGKEVVSERIHRRSPRSAAPLVRLHCAALPETLFESELFGHERGAFTGAVAAKPGLLETADGGTILLDEVGELPMSIQVKLLRVLEERKVLRVGGLKARPIDVRFIAATNRDLAAEVARGAFRQDLYYRLNGISFVIPPLRERLDELEALASTFIAGAWAQHGTTPPPALAPAALACLRAHAWPGNIRELRNVIERAVFLCGTGRVITPAHLPDEISGLAPAGWPASDPLAVIEAEAEREREPEREPEREAEREAESEAEPEREPEPTAAVPSIDGDAPVTVDRDVAERDRILTALAACAGNQTRAAVLLGMSRRTLVSRLGILNLPRPRAPTVPTIDRDRSDS
jgi:transcriptional regulator with PAS, ATPase and Fis domain